METHRPAAPIAARNGGFAMSSSQPSRKEWRAVSDQSVRNSADEDLERSKLVHSDERLIYEVQHGREAVDVDFRSINIDGGLDNNDILQQRLHALAKQREELQHIEVEIRAQVIARSEIVEMQNSFDTKLKEHATGNAKLQEQLHEKEKKIHDLERKMEEKERELHAIRVDTEAAWAKHDLLREQSKELQSYMRERDNSEAERVQHITQIHDLQERIQEKDRMLMELQEQHRIAQETIIFKDEQLREAQAWMTRAQEMDALQSTTNHTLQAELRERTEHYNQLWLGCQSQFAEMERLHLRIQQLQLELADVREKSGSNLEGTSISSTNLKNDSEIGQSNGHQFEVNGNGSPSANSGSLQNGIAESASGDNTSAQVDNVHIVAYGPSLLGLPTFGPSGQVTALHPFLMHQQGVSPTSHVMQSHFHSASAISSTQNWQNQQTQADGQHVPTHNEYPQETEINVSRIDTGYDYNAPGNGQIHHANYEDTNISRGLDADSVVPSANGVGQVDSSTDKTYDPTQSPLSLQQISSQFRDALSLDPLVHASDSKEKQVNQVSDREMENKSASMEHFSSAVSSSSSEISANAKNLSGTTTNTVLSADLVDVSVGPGQKNNKVGESKDIYLLDERALLASIARTIGPGARIRISSTLPNRLGKMLAPLHWHDYKRKYGKLDDFVASHPELFFIEGDYIQLRDGAQQIIAATSAVAKVAAAVAATPSSYSSSVALTPMAQSHRLQKGSVLESSSLNGSEIKLGRSTVLPVGNGTNSDKTDLSQGKGASHGRQQSRANGAASGRRR